MDFGASVPSLEARPSTCLTDGAIPNLANQWVAHAKAALLSDRDVNVKFSTFQLLCSPTKVLEQKGLVLLTKEPPALHIDASCFTHGNRIKHTIISTSREKNLILIFVI